MSREQRPSSIASVVFAIGVSFAWAATTAPVSADPAKGTAPPSKPSASAGGVGFAPDPPIAASTRTYRYPVRAKDGAVVVDKPKLVTHATPVATPRNLGRFALELYVGRELLERHRFDLPLLDDLPKKKTPNGAPDFARHANTRVFIDLPDLERATYAVWVDRATGAKKRVFWPPVDDFVPIPIGSARPSASVSASASPAPSASAPPR